MILHLSGREQLSHISHHLCKKPDAATVYGQSLAMSWHEHGKANFCCNGFYSKGNVKHADTAERTLA